MVWTGGSQGDLAPAIEALFDQADARWPDRSKASDGTLGDQAHASRTSDHNPKEPNPPGWVDAGDLTYDPDHGVDLFAIAEQIRLRRDPRVKFLIFFARIAKSYVDSAGRPAWEWQPYTGPNAHKSHMHISVTPEGRHDTGPWFPDDEEDDMYDKAARDEVVGKLDAILTQFGPEFTTLKNYVVSIQQKVGAVVADPAEIARQVLAGLDGGALTDAQVAALIAAMPDAVKQALREGVG